jgi:hypothetical protein
MAAVQGRAEGWMHIDPRFPCPYSPLTFYNCLSVTPGSESNQPIDVAITHRRPSVSLYWVFAMHSMLSRHPLTDEQT